MIIVHQVIFKSLKLIGLQLLKVTPEYNFFENLNKDKIIIKILKRLVFYN